MTKPTPSKKQRIIYLGYDDIDDLWEVTYSKDNLENFAFYIEVKVPNNPRGRRKAAKIGEFEVEILEAA